MATPTRVRFTLPGADGGPLRGDVRTTAGTVPRPAVVICHGFKGFKDWGFFPFLAERLARSGLTAVSFNFSGSGVGEEEDRFSEPTRFGHATFGNDLRDLTTVVGAVRNGTLVADLAPATRVGLVGHSRGGGVGILFCAGAATPVESLVTWSAIGSTMRWGPETVAQWRRDGSLAVTNQRTGEVLPLYTDVLDELEGDGAGQLDILAAAERVQVPWLIVHGEVDESVPREEARLLHRASGERAELLLIPRAGHTFGARHPWGGSSVELDQVMNATVSWLLRTLF